jgi:hypothetical protein
MRVVTEDIRNGRQYVYSDGLYSFRIPMHAVVAGVGVVACTVLSSYADGEILWFLRTASTACGFVFGFRVYQRFSFWFRHERYERVIEERPNVTPGYKS